jgi:hypothetical protein
MWEFGNIQESRVFLLESSPEGGEISSWTFESRGRIDEAREFEVSAQLQQLRYVLVHNSD